MQRVKANAIFDSDEEKWLISGQAINYSLLQNELCNYNAKFDSTFKKPYQKPEMVDSGLESNSGSAIVIVNKNKNNCEINKITDNNQTPPQLNSGYFNVNKKIFCNELLLKRPVSLFLIYYF